MGTPENEEDFVMKGRKTIVAVVLLFALLLSSCGQGSLLQAE